MPKRLRDVLWGSLLACWLLAQAAPASAQGASVTKTTAQTRAKAAADPMPAQRCITAAAGYHQVNAHILWAILKVESNFVASVVTGNTNGSQDYGLGGINTIHLPELARHGVAPQDLQDACVNTYVAAWLLSRQMARYGNTWFGVAAYHSATPYFNQRYQILLRNALVEAKVLAGHVEKVPALVSNASPFKSPAVRTAFTQTTSK